MDVNLRSLPPRVRERATQIISAMQKGMHWSMMGGRRLNNQRLIVFKLPQGWRVIAKETAACTRVITVCTHQAYDKLINQKR